ncbi:hypothetical protein GQ44DRAFT_778176 [Phaeosphaeriaceae sp. PMI808]|nr:hypothetical protein GQ44DRAFT_778176 [Phaeosphaeriaceae sp. PMI808]
MWKAAANLSDDQASTVLRNPWESLVQINVDDNLAEKIGDSPYVYFDELYLASIVVLDCISTVFDIKYTAINHTITSIERTPSNSSIAGIASMTTLNMWQMFGVIGDNIASDTSYLSSSLDDVVKNYAKRVSSGYATVIAAQTTHCSALAVQLRSFIIITAVSKAAIWMLIVAHILFALLGIGLASAAFLLSSDICQSHIRMNITGLTAHLFEGKHAERLAQSEEDLFEERDGDADRIVKRVAIEKSNEEGSMFTLLEGWEGY